MLFFFFNNIELCTCRLVNAQVVANETGTQGGTTPNIHPPGIQEFFIGGVQNKTGVQPVYSVETILQLIISTLPDHCTYYFVVNFNYVQYMW